MADDKLRDQVSRAVCAMTTGAERTDAVMQIIREHVAAAVQGERQRLVMQLELMVKFPGSDAAYSKGSADGFNTAVDDLLSLLRDGTGGHSVICDSCRSLIDGWTSYPYRWHEFSQDQRRRYDRLRPVVEDYYDLVRQQIRIIREACLRLHQGAPA